MVKPAIQAAAFVERLPRRPYCTDDPAQGLLIRSQATALAYRHIQHNPPPHVSSLVFDIDHPEGYAAWREAGLPTPHWISINQSETLDEQGNSHRGRAHIGYLLATPVARTNAARQKPLRYLAAIEHVMAHRLGGRHAILRANHQKPRTQRLVDDLAQRGALFSRLPSGILSGCRASGLQPPQSQKKLADWDVT